MKISIPQFSILLNHFNLKLVLFCFIVFSCSSAKFYNKKIDKLHSEKSLKKDIDFVYRKLQSHPSLNWYISKKELDYKFDSLKAAIDHPMTSNEFYFKISPLIASVHQGHMSISPLVEKYSKKQRELYNSSKGPISQFEYVCDENKIFVLKNNSYLKDIKIGSEVLSINNIKPSELIQKYKNTLTSDGFNQTFIKQTLERHVVNYYFYELGLRDSLKFQFSLNDSISTIWVKRVYADSTIEKDTIENKLTPKEKLKQKKLESNKKFYNGYNKNTQQYSKNFSLLEDSTVAYLKINDFVYGQYSSFYKNCFKKIDSLNVNSLIIDLRGNKGGRLREIQCLYSYLVDSNYVFIQKSEVASRFSILHINYFGKSPLLVKAIKAVFYPIFVTVLVSKTSKSKDGKFYFTTKASKKSSPRKPNFKGKIYVLIDGESFSASCILSSDLKGTKRAFFVGEETGGAYNGTVAGFLPVFSLPNTKLDFRMGLLNIRPTYQSETDGRGIFPDVEIVPTINDQFIGIDPVMNWVLGNIKK